MVVKAKSLAEASRILLPFGIDLFGNSFRDDASNSHTERLPSLGLQMVTSRQHILEAGCRISTVLYHPAKSPLVEEKRALEREPT